MGWYWDCTNYLKKNQSLDLPSSSSSPATSLLLSRSCWCSCWCCYCCFCCCWCWCCCWWSCWSCHRMEKKRVLGVKQLCRSFYIIFLFPPLFYCGHSDRPIVVFSVMKFSFFKPFQWTKKHNELEHTIFFLTTQTRATQRPPCSPTLSPTTAGSTSRWTTS